MVGQLVKSGFFDTPAAAVGNETDPHGIAHFAQKVLTSLQGTITGVLLWTERLPEELGYLYYVFEEEQTGKIQQLVAEFYDDIAELREERIQLNRDIVQFFSGQVGHRVVFNNALLPNMIVDFCWPGLHSGQQKVNFPSLACLPV